MSVVAVGDASAPPTITLESEARALAGLHQPLSRAGRQSLRGFHGHDHTRVARALERARRSLVSPSSSSGALPKATEWFLDNYHLVRRVARQVTDELPAGFLHRLPRLSSPHGQPRIDSVAIALVAKADVTLDLAVLHRFIDAYQEVAPLTIAELWALPSMLRAAVLRHLIKCFAELAAAARIGQPSSSDAVAPIERRSVDRPTGVEKSIRTLRVLDVLDWKAFFERASRVESILRTDPSDVYVRMDFETCDSYRKVVEALAWRTGKTEEQVAQAAVALANEEASDHRHGHVGYYLIAEGRAALEVGIGYRPDAVERLRRAATAHPTSSYLLPLAFLTLAPLVALVCWLTIGSTHRSLVPQLAAVLLAVVPVSSAAVAFLQFVFARLLPPRVLPKLDFKTGLPRDIHTLVVMPTLLGRAEDVTSMLRQIELHYLSNPDPELQFALLTDLVDAETLPVVLGEDPFLEAASLGIGALNAKHGVDGVGPFHLLHRKLGWNPAEGRFMGWERKRGKLEELNRLLRGDANTSYTLHIGNSEGLKGVRFVITLDSDTQLPMGSAHRLVGLLAHPLNRAVFEPHTRRVIEGYTIVQPRIETSPSSSSRTPFSRFFAGDVGFDIYTHACSELYQDLFGSGVYVGKGIYEVDAFVRSLGDRVPENTLVSHDLFEGIQGRTALASDIVLFESYPSSYAAYALRMHRWLRGDWQLCPWLLPTVPSSGGAHVTNTLLGADRWKIVDNLRRSLSTPCLFALLVLGWTILPGSSALWTVGVLALLAAPSAPAFARGGRSGLVSVGRYALGVAFLAYESSIVLDAIVRVWARMTVTKKLLLQWTAAADTAVRIEARSQRGMYWVTMMPSPLSACAALALVAWVRPTSLGAAVPLLIVWALAPEVARWASHSPSSHAEQIAELQRKALRHLARRTWRFFDAFVGPGDQWLPVDNHQEEPREQTAHRTSPTNIGLMLLSTLSAYDFGYIGPLELSVRLRSAFKSIARLAHYQGHLLNWYDTRSLEPLLPRYVSTVDSGNLAGCLLALRSGCQEVAAANVLRAAPWEGLVDSIELLDGVVETAPTGTVAPLRATLARMQAAALRGRDNLPDSYATLRTLNEEACGDLDRELHAFLEAGAHRHEPDLLRALRTSVDRLHQHIRHMQTELDTLVPWLALREDAAAHGLALPTGVRLDEVAAASERLRIALETTESSRREHGEVSPELSASAGRLDAAFRAAETAGSALAVELLALAARADEEARGMDFKLLYDPERRLFRIGYNATIDQVDSHHYDLLASEARLASYIAIVKRDVPEAHWFALGRPMTSVGGAPALLSWGGTMFEYLMPCLLMRSQEGTLLAQTCALAVNAQVSYGKKRSEPWGVSESAFARTDADSTYQYRSFGVPGLGFKRGLDEDRVVTPYASILAVSIRPHAVLENLARLEAMGMVGTYGLFEALDFTPSRAAELAVDGQHVAVVRSYMAHHQGMILVALGNLLNRRSMVDRFHANAMIETGQDLLNERAPEIAPAEWPVADPAKPAQPSESSRAPRAPRAPAPWVPSGQGPQAFVLSNGRITSLLTSGGGGGLSWRGLALTRYEPDATSDDGGWLYLRDEESRRVWRATSQEGRTTYAMHRAEFHLRCEGISVHVDVAVAASDDVEVRQVTLHNETDRPRHVSLTSAARPVLLDAKQASSHPAFSSMFVVSEQVSELDGVLFARRRQSTDEEPCVLLHRLVREGPGVIFGGFETDRVAFFGRGASAEMPQALSEAGSGLHGRVGPVLDPVMSVMAQVELRAKGSATLAFVTSVARSRSGAVDLARRYGSMHAVSWAFRDAEQESPRRLQRAKLDPALLPAVQHLFSAMLFADATVRPPPEARAATPPCQERLWVGGSRATTPSFSSESTLRARRSFTRPWPRSASSDPVAFAWISSSSTNRLPVTRPKGQGLCGTCLHETTPPTG